MCPVMLVIQTDDGRIRWMDVKAFLQEQRQQTNAPVKRITFRGDEFNCGQCASDSATPP